MAKQFCHACTPYHWSTPTYHEPGGECPTARHREEQRMAKKRTAAEKLTTKAEKAEEAHRGVKEALFKMEGGLLDLEERRDRAAGRQTRARQIAERGHNLR